MEGYDAAAKVVILGNLLMDLPLRLADVERRGISHIRRDHIAAARAEGKRLKLVGTLEAGGGHCRATVKPELLADNHPLAAISGSTNAIVFHTELLGDITLAGPGAGRLETGYAVIEDILAIHRFTQRQQGMQP